MVKQLFVPSVGQSPPLCLGQASEVYRLWSWQGPHASSSPIKHLPEEGAEAQRGVAQQSRVTGWTLQRVPVFFFAGMSQSRAPLMPRPL